MEKILAEMAYYLEITGLFLTIEGIIIIIALFGIAGEIQELRRKQ